MTRKGAQIRHYELYRYRKGWSLAAKCTALLVGPEVAEMGMFLRFCREMKVTPP